MFAIYKKELRSFFINPIGYIYTGAFLGLAALICCYTTIISSSYSTTTYFTIMMFAMGILIPCSPCASSPRSASSAPSSCS